jgi:hypothetical protein
MKSGLDGLGGAYDVYDVVRPSDQPVSCPELEPILTKSLPLAKSPPMGGAAIRDFLIVT